MSARQINSQTSDILGFVNKRLWPKFEQFVLHQYHRTSAGSFADDLTC